MIEFDLNEECSECLNGKRYGHYIAIDAEYVGFYYDCDLCNGTGKRFNKKGFNKIEIEQQKE